MKPSEKFKPGTLIRPKRSLWYSEDALYSESARTRSSSFETGEVLYRTYESEIGKIWCNEGYRYPFELENTASSDWLYLLHKITIDDIYMVVKAPVFQEVPTYFKRDYTESGFKVSVSFLSMMVSFGEYNWEIPIIVSKDSYLAYKLLRTRQLHELFSSPDIWYSQIFDAIG